MPKAQVQTSEQRKLTDGGVRTAGLHDAASGIALDGVEVLADAGEVLDGALGVLLDGVLKAGTGAGGDVLDGLGAGEGGEGNGDD